MRDCLGHPLLKKEDFLHIVLFKIFTKTNRTTKHLVIDVNIKNTNCLKRQRSTNNNQHRYMNLKFKYYPIYLKRKICSPA